MRKKLSVTSIVLAILILLAPSSSQAFLMIPPGAQSKTPVLIIPGIMGTEIFKDTEQLWPDIKRMLVTPGDNFMDPLAYKSDGNPLDTSLSIGQVLKNPEGLFDYTGLLLNDLSNQGYVQGQNLFMFPYDWRKDFSEVANHELKNRVNQILTSTGASKIDIVAHSQGGLIIKRLLFDQPELQNKISKLIFVGVPHLGSLKATKTLLYGDTMGVNFLGLGLDPQEVKDIGLNMPSIYDLLPSREYVNREGAYLFFQQPSGQYRIYGFDETKNFLKDNSLNQSLIDQADNFHVGDYDNFDLSNSGILIYNIVGCQTPTYSRIFIPQNRDPFLQTSAGDGTVVVSSAVGSVGQILYARKSNHASMLGENGTRQEIVNLLAGSQLNTQNNITTNAADCHYKAKIISVRSPVELHVYDQLGNHVGPTAKGLDLQIPEAQYDILGHNKFAILPDGQEYRIELVATDNGTFDLYSTNIEDGNKINTAYYNEIGVNLGSRAELVVDDSNTRPLSLDRNGDGQAEQQIPPSALLNNTQSQDVTSPQTTINIVGSEGQSRFFRSDVAISFSAMDPDATAGSGLLKTQYELDGSQPEIYKGQVNVSSQGHHLLSYWSTDKAGNREPVRKVEFTIDKIPPEIITQFDPTTQSLKFSGDDNLTAREKLSVSEQGDVVEVEDQAGNTVQLQWTDKDWRKSLKAEIKSLFYNSHEAQLGKASLKFEWGLDKFGGFKQLFQDMVSKEDFDIHAHYQNQITNLVGRDYGSVINKILPGMVLLKIKTNNGDLFWYY